MTATTPFIVDSDSPDVQILEAYERVRAARAYGYSLADLPETPQIVADLDARDLVMIEDESQVHRNFATTPGGIRARLMLLLPSEHQDRWIDETLATHGLAALCRRRTDLDGNGQQLLWAIVELLHLEWETALSECEAAVAEHRRTISLQGAAHQSIASARAAGADMEPLDRLYELVEEQFAQSNDAGALNRMIRTLVPSHDALRKKIEIVDRENFEEASLPWIARDVAFLAGLTVNLENSDAA